MSSPRGSWSWFGEHGSPLRTAQSLWTWAVMLAFSPHVCLGCGHPCKNSLPAGGSGGGGSCYCCGQGDDEGPGKSQKRGGLKGTSWTSPLHHTPALCPHGFLDLFSPFFGTSQRHYLLPRWRGVIHKDIFIGKGGQWLHCFSQLPDAHCQLVWFINLRWLSFLCPKL